MKKIWHLSTCSTCERIIKELDLKKRGFVFQNIREEKITPVQLDRMKEMSGSYEALFSRVALKYRSLKLNEMQLSEKDYRRYILQEDTFLKRPVVIFSGKIFIGNTPKNILALKKALDDE